MYIISDFVESEKLRTFPFYIAQIPPFAAFLSIVESFSIDATCSDPVAVGPGQNTVTVTPVTFTS